MTIPAPLPAAARQVVTAADGPRLAVYSHGDPTAPTVLCVHGYPDNASVWDGVVARLADRYHVVTYDVRGAGSSTAPDDRSGYALHHLVDDLARVADAVRPDGRPVHLLAHDWGSLQAWHAVTDERTSARFASYTSISGPCLDHLGHWLRSRVRANPRRLAQLLNQTARSGYIGFFHLPVLPELSWLSGVGGLTLAGMERIGAPAGPRPRAQRALRDYLNGMNLYRANMRERLTRPGARHASVPVQVLAPTKELFMVESAQRCAERWVPDFRFHRVNGGHWIPRTHPDVVARRVSTLVEEVDSGRAAVARPTATAAAGTGRPRRFRGQLAVVTGAGSGIGRATAFELAEQGARVVCVDIDEETAARTADLAALLGPEAAHYGLDVADGAATDRFAKWVRAEHGVPDIVINNAGIGVGGSFLASTPADWRRTIDTNLWGVINGCRAFAPMMVENGGGRIVNTASAAAYLPSRAYPVYATTKSAVLTLSRCLRGELAEHGIRVTAVCPGLVNTGIIATARFTDTDDDGAVAVRERVSRLYRLRGYPPEKAARRIVRALDRGPELLPVTSEAHGGLVLSRIAPALLRAAARVRPPLG